LFVARQVGLDPTKVLTGSELEGMPETEATAALRQVSAFARMTPEQKLRLVELAKWWRSSTNSTPAHLRS
jgi:Ca2+-transporting ATPase